MPCHRIPNGILCTSNEDDSERLTEETMPEPIDYNHDMNVDERRATLIELRTVYVEAVDGDNERRRRAVEIAMMVLTEPLDCHGDLFPDEDWEHPCLCRECKSCS